MMSVAPYFLATSTEIGRVPAANNLPAPKSLAPAIAERPTAPIPITNTDPPNGMSAFSDPIIPVDHMSVNITAASSDIPSGMKVKFASAMFTWNLSPNTPSLKLENFQPPRGSIVCEGNPL